MLKKLSIKRKLFLLIIVVFALSITVAVIYAGVSFMNSSKKVSADIAKVINESYRVKVETEIQKGISNLQSLSVNLQIKNKQDAFEINNSTIKATRNYIFLNDYITDFFLILSDNKKRLYNSKYFKDSISEFSLAFKKTKEGIHSTIYNEANYRFNFRNFKNIDNQNDFIISEPFLINNLGNNIFVITISKPIYINNKVVGAIGINFSLSEISDIINSVSNYDNNAKLILLTENERVIFVSQKSWLSGKNIKYSQTEEQKILSQIKKGQFSNIGVKGFACSFSMFSIKNTNTKWKIVTAIPYNVFITELISDIYISIIIATLIMVLGLFVVIYFIKKSFSPVDDILIASQKISKGELVNLKETSETEFGKIALSFNIISKNLEEASNISSQIANGNYDIRISEKSEKDVLSKSINKIAENLKEAKAKSILQDDNTYVQLWMRKGRFEVAEAERKSENNISDLTYNILREIVNYTGAILGGLYLYNNEKEQIDLVASYAYETKKQINKRFRLGEGLIGSCVLEEKRIVINDVPDDYINIVSGLGNGKPSNISIIPIFYQGKINSVIELAFINKPKDYVIDFVERLGDNIGAWIDASLINSKTANLLKISRSQTEELAEKENELNVKVQELEKIKSEIGVQNAEYKSKMNAINHTVMTVEYTLDGIVIDSNAKYEELMGYSSKDIKGINVFNLVKDQRDDLKHIIEEVSKGNPIKRQVKRYTKTGEEKWFSATYTPYYNEGNKITRVLFFAHDITEMKVELNKYKTI